VVPAGDLSSVGAGPTGPQDIKSALLLLTNYVPTPRPNIRFP